MKSVNHTKKFTQPNIKDILRRAAALRNASGAVVAVLLICTRIAKIGLLVTFRPSEK